MSDPQAPPQETTAPTTTTPSSDNPGWIGYVGCIVIILVLVGIVFGIYSAVRKSSPAVISQTAYFVEDPTSSENPRKSHLKISGMVHQAGEPLAKGNVRLTVTKKDLSFQQIISVDITNGAFKTEDEALRGLKPDDPIRITAEVSPSQLADTVTQDLYLNTTPPGVSPTTEFVLWIVCVSLLILFFILFLVIFTGTRTAAKNRFAIIFSYIIIGVSLLVPLLLPVLVLHVFPGVRRAMVGAPAGLVITRVGSLEDGKTQWALNIGGYSWRPVAPPAKVAETAAANKPAIQATPPVAVRGRERTSPSPAVASGSPTLSGVNPAIAQANGSPAPVLSSATPQTIPSPAAVTSSGSPQPISSPALPGSSPQTVVITNSSPAVIQVEPPTGSRQQIENADDVVVVEGGLVIPLYVIILSLIGGAINMTRKVPRFQSEGEYSEMGVSLPTAKGVATQIEAGIRHFDPRGSSPSPPVEDSAATVASPAAGSISFSPAERRAAEATADAGATEKKLDEQAKGIDVELEQLVKDQVKRNSVSKNTIVGIRKRVQLMRELFDSRTDEERLLGFDSFEDWLASRVSLKEVLGPNWRVELLNQYMYLISAPFLAIVAYYMLDLLGLTKQPILVLISFSVGLISERILSWLLGIAAGYLRTDARAQAAATK